MKRIYVAGPYTHGDVAVNVRTAMEAGNFIVEAGHSPFVPHLYHFMHMHQPHVYEIWTALDLAWVEACHAVFRIEGHSSGADAEADYAKKLGIPVFTDINALLGWLKK